MSPAGAPPSAVPPGTAAGALAGVDAPGRESRARIALGVLLGFIARLWLATLRVRVEVSPSLAKAEIDARPWVLAFLHGEQWPLLAWKRRRRTTVMVSLSADGAMQARALGRLGFDVVRGSSSRRGARGLAAIVRRLRAGAVDAAFAVDGPRGPYGVAKPGALVAAARSGAVVVPMGAAVRRGRILSRAWDRFVLAWPFSEVAVVLGDPLDPMDPRETEMAAPSADDRGQTALAREPADGADLPPVGWTKADADAAALSTAILEAGERARAILAASGGPVVRFSLSLSGADGD